MLGFLGIFFVNLVANTQDSSELKKHNGKPSHRTQEKVSYWAHWRSEMKEIKETRWHSSNMEILRPWQDVSHDSCLQCWPLVDRGWTLATCNCFSGLMSGTNGQRTGCSGGVRRKRPRVNTALYVALLSWQPWPSGGLGRNLTYRHGWDSQHGCLADCSWVQAATHL